MSKPGFGQDKHFVLQQYKTADNLALRRRTHEIYSADPEDFISWNLDRLNWTGREQVLDVGCGDGGYAQAAQDRAGTYFAGDFSWGMLHSLHGLAANRINLDAQTLPIPANSMDVILANHMIYHIPEQAKAIAEFVRVLRPGGQLLAATNSADNMPELTSLLMEVMDRLGVDKSQIAWPRATLSFTLENGAALLTQFFAQVTRHDFPGALVFPEPQPLIDYLSSMRGRYLELMPAGLTWDMIAGAMEGVLSDHIHEHGSYRVSKLAGTFVCGSHWW